jgi:hypothetical protein
MSVENRYASSTEYFPISIPDDFPSQQAPEDPDTTEEIEKEKEDDPGNNE